MNAFVERTASIFDLDEPSGAELAMIERLKRKAASEFLKPVLRLADTSSYMRADLPASRFAVRPSIPMGCVTLLGAHGGVGKSLFALTLAAHFAAHRSFFGYEVAGGLAAFVSLEDPSEVVSHRLKRIVQEFALPVDAVSRNLRIIDGTDGDGALATENAYERRLVETPNLSAMRELIGDARLVVIDNTSDAFDGNENDRRMVRAFMRMLAQIARDKDSGMLCLAHIDKVSAKYGAFGNSYSGSTAWHNSARSRLALVAREGGMVELRHEKSNLGVCAEPMLLRWTGDGLLVPARGSDGAASGEASAVALEDAAAVFAALCAAKAADISVPTGRVGASTAQNVLATLPSFPPSLRGPRGRDRFWEALGRLHAEGRAHFEEYRTAQRHKRTRIIPIERPPNSACAEPPITPGYSARAERAPCAEVRQTSIGADLAEFSALQSEIRP